MFNIQDKILHFIIIFSIRYFNFLKIKKNHSNNLILIRVDAIGDYILFRNFISCLKSNHNYEDYNITFLGNIIWKDLSKNLDKNYINEFIWLDKNKFQNNILYKIKLFLYLKRKKYELLISPVHSRDFFITDSIVFIINASKKIGSFGDYKNINPLLKKLSDLFYNQLIYQNDKYKFEFENNKYFFEKLINKKINLKKPFIKKQTEIVYRNYVILFIGAGSQNRKWKTKFFSEVGNFIVDQLHLDIILCGGNEDRDQVKIFKNYFHYNFLDMVGKTSLTQMLKFIHKSEFILTNETSMAHLAVALSVKNIFVVSNGNHLGRFTPYPKDIYKNYHVIFHKNIYNILSNQEQLRKCYGFESPFDTNSISVTDVIQSIKMNY